MFFSIALNDEEIKTELHLTEYQSGVVLQINSIILLKYPEYIQLSHFNFIVIKINEVGIIQMCLLQHYWLIRRFKGSLTVLSCFICDLYNTMKYIW